MFSRPVIAIAALALLTAGCGTSGDNASVTTGNGPGGGSPGSSATPSAPATAAQDRAAPATCGTATLRARLSLNGVAAGNRFATLVLTNKGSAPCHTYGYVGLKLTGGGDPPTKAVRTDEVGPPKRVTLKPGRSAWARLQWGAVSGTGDEQTGDCQPTAKSVWVTPPDQRDHLTVKWSYGPVCERGTIRVNPLRPGSHDPRS